MAFWIADTPASCTKRKKGHQGSTHIIPYIAGDSEAVKLIEEVRPRWLPLDLILPV